MSTTVMPATPATPPVTSLVITSTSTPSLSGSYGIGSLETGGMQGEVNAIALNGTFADGSATVNWPDTKGASHAFTVAQFKELVTAVGLYRAQLLQHSAGILATAPSNTATIP